MYITRNSGNSNADKAGKTNNKRQEVNLGMVHFLLHLGQPLHLCVLLLIL
jgi:hypothetical protein